jgi:aminomuconate-semialdehyde/2-hydroxymuconate-6-semialdehyde dehydrogenase
VTLELRQEPNIVFADADLGEVVKTSVRAAFDNQGEICLCGSRVFVEEKAYPEFVQRFVAGAKQLKVGDPLEPGTDQGALVSRGHRDKVLSYLRLAKEEGGEFLCGGGPATGLNERCRDGYFVQPTVITGLGPTCRVNQEEIFGPVVTVMPFKDEDEVVRTPTARRTDCGVGGTRDLKRALAAEGAPKRYDLGELLAGAARAPFGMARRRP